MRIHLLAFIMALMCLGFAQSVSVEVIEPAGNVRIYNESGFNVSLNVSCGATDCNETNVSLFAAPAPASCMQIHDANPGAADGIYLVCPDVDTCRNVYCDMTNGGWASIFVMESDLNLTDRYCIMDNYNDDMDSTILWTDLTGKVSSTNQDDTAYQNWFTWNRDGGENMTQDYLPGRPGGMGDYARPVPLPAAGQTVWFDWQNELVVWDGGSAAFADLDLNNPSMFSDYNSFYFISDGVNMIHVGPVYGGDAVLLTFDFINDDVSSEAASYMNPPNGWWGTEQDSFGHVLYTVNGRAMYFDSYSDSGPTGYFALGGNLSDPDSQYDVYAVEAWSDPWQPGLDFFTMVDEDGYLWFGDWGHDNGGYFNCGDDEFLGIGKTNIMLTYEGASTTSGELVSEDAGAVPFYTTDANPQTISLLAGESAVVDYEVFGTEPGTYLFYATANETGDPYLGNASEIWIVTTLNRIPPVPEQAWPMDNHYMYPGDLTFEFSCGDGIIDTVELWTNTSGTWTMIYTNSSYSEGELLQHNVYSLDLGRYQWAVWCNATYGGSAWSANRTIDVVDSGLFMCANLDTPGTYNMLTDVYADPDSTCFTLESDDVVLDCGGHSIIGTGCSIGQSGVYSTYQNTTVRNCTITEFCNDIYFDTGSGNGLIEDNNLSNADIGARLEWSDGNSVLDNYIENTDIGFYLYYANSNQIGRNHVVDSADANFGSGSCPFLYLWDGNGYEYYTDLASEVIGKPKYETPLYEAGIYELGDFKAEDGAYRMKVREVIPESDFFDELKLLIVDVPEGYGVLNQWHNTYSDDMAPPKEFMTIKDPKTPISATDKYGEDVLSEVSLNDGVPLHMQVDDPNWVIVDFGQIDNPQYAKLVISGWSAYGTDIDAPDQENLVVETMNEAGEWEVAKRFGKFTGDSRTFVFDIAGILEQDDTRMRISAAYSGSNAKIIDQILLDDSEPVEIAVTAVDPSVANLQWGGSTNLNYTAIGHRISATDEQLPDSDQDLMYGNFTRYGDVRPLLEEADDMFAIMRHGDVIELEFPDIAPAEGMDRYAFLQADVMYSVKYSGSGEFVSDSVALMPFHGMSQYPYGEGESYPYDEAHLNYIAEWNTRTYEPPVKYGGSLPYSYNNTVFENVISGDIYSIGLHLEYEDSTGLLDNNISGVETGIDIYDSVNTIVQGNRVHTALGRGIIVRSGSDGTQVLDNVISSDNSDSCYYDGCGAVFLGDSDYCLFDGNVLTAVNGYGMYVGKSYYNNVTNNSINATDDQQAVYITKSSTDNMFLHNDIWSDYWVYDDVGGNDFDDASSGNTYYAEDGTGAWELFDIRDTNGDGWADAGADLPFSNAVVGDYWLGNDEDWHPGVVSAPVPTPSSGGDKERKPLSLEVQSSCEGNSVIITSKGQEVSGAEVSVMDDDTLESLGSGETGDDGELEFTGCGITVRVYASKSGYSTASGTYSLAGCEECEQAPECTDDSACPDSERCSASECVHVPCACGVVQGHACAEYDCCSDSDCGSGRICTGHACVAAEAGPECLSDSDCGQEMECRDGKCAAVEPQGEPAADTQVEAASALDDAQTEIEAARSSGKDTGEAQAKLDAAKEAYDAGDYELAKELADAAKFMALNALAGPAPEGGEETSGEAAPPAQGNVLGLILILMIVGAIALAGGYWLLSGKKK